MPNVNIKYNGGVLCDSVGLGKTFSMISLVVENLNNNNYPTLLFCPPRLCVQWVEEINKTYDLKYKLIKDIRQFKKLTLEEIKCYESLGARHGTRRQGNRETKREQKSKQNVSSKIRTTLLFVIASTGRQRRAIGC